MLIVVLALLLPADPPKPTSHTIREIEGWTVHIDDRLLKGEDEPLGQRAIKAMEGQLFSITLVMPVDKLKRIRQVPIWLDRTHGKLTPAQYHPSANWLAENGYDRALVKCVHVPDAQYFAESRHQREQPCAMLHELAHAYHDQVLDFENKDVKDAWKKIVESGRFKSVLHIDGKDRKHYALTNQMEFFAEMTEAYFGRNDFYPFNSGELRRAEPEVFELLAKIWGPLP